MTNPAQTFEDVGADLCQQHKHVVQNDEEESTTKDHEDWFGAIVMCLCIVCGLLFVVGFLVYKQVEYRHLVAGFEVALSSEDAFTQVTEHTDEIRDHDDKHQISDSALAYIHNFDRDQTVEKFEPANAVYVPFQKFYPKRRGVVCKKTSAGNFHIGTVPSAGVEFLVRPSHRAPHLFCKAAFGALEVSSE